MKRFIKSDHYFKQLKRVGNYFQQTLQLPAACLKFRWSENKIVSGFYFCGYLWISQYLWILLLRQSIRLCDCGSMSGYYFCAKASKLLSDQHTLHSLLFFLIVSPILKSQQFRENFVPHRKLGISENPNFTSAPQGLLSNQYVHQ